MILSHTQVQKRKKAYNTSVVIFLKTHQNQENATVRSPELSSILLNSDLASLLVGQDSHKSTQHTTPSRQTEISRDPNSKRMVSEKEPKESREFRNLSLLYTLGFCLSPMGSYIEP